MCRKFEIAYVLCKEGLAFRKKVPFCELEEKHGVDLGIGYKNRDACADFVKYIAQVQMDQLTTVLAKAKFLSIEADGTTDAANKEEELFMVVYFDPHCEDSSVHVQNRFLTVRNPNRSNAEGLYECFVRAMTYAGVDGHIIIIMYIHKIMSGQFHNMSDQILLWPDIASGQFWNVILRTGM